MKFFSMKKVFTTQNLSIMALMLALNIPLSYFSIYLTPSFKILSFGYLPGAIVSMLFGPWAGLVFGFASDFLGYIVRPEGPYFPLYALSNMAANLLYALFLYRKPLSPLRVLLAQLSVTVFVTFGLNFFWNRLLYGSAASLYFTGVRFLSNGINLFVYVFLILFFGKLCMRLLKQ